VTLSTVKNYIQPDTDDDDGLISTLLRWASAEIRDYTGRMFTRPPVTEQRTLYLDGTRSVRLDDPLSDITEIIAPLTYYVDGELYPLESTLTADQYELRTRPTGTTLRFDFPATGKFLVSGTWGWQQIPGAVEAATTLTVDEWYRGNVLPPTGTREEGASEGRNLYLPREVQETLNQWVMKEYVV